MKNRPLLSIFLIVLIDILGFTIILPLLPFYAERFGASPAVVGWLLSSYGICQLISGPILGQISDRIGRKPILLVSQAGTFIGFMMLALSNNLALIFIARIIDGLTAGNISVAQAYIADVTDPKNRAKAFGLIGIAFGFGFLVGPALAGYLSQFGHAMPIFAAAGLSGLSILATASFLPSKPKVEGVEASSGESTGGRSLNWKVYAGFFQEEGLKNLLWQFTAFVFAFSIFFSGFALFAERRFSWHGVPFGPREVGYVFAYGGVLGMFIQGGLIGRLVKWCGESKLVKTGFLLTCAGFLGLGVAHQISELMIAITISFVGVSMIRPALTSLITQKGGRERQGTVLGLTQSLMSVSQITAPFISGILIQHQFLRGWAWAGALAAGSGFLLCRLKPQTANQNQL